MKLRWRPIGKIFDPRDHGLLAGCEEFAQAPQAVLLEDRVRIFFSTRRRDSATTYTSHVSYADFSHDLQNVIDVAKDEVVALGGLGTFDEHGIFPINIFNHEGRIYGFTTGWSRRVSVSADSAIGQVISEDGGKTFRKIGQGPILSANLDEPFLIADGTVVEYKNEFRMFYIFGTRWVVETGTPHPERVYRIGTARSTDLINWHRTGRPIIPTAIGENECQALPAVFGITGIHAMVFAYRHHKNFRTDPSCAYRLGFAWSEDLEEWIRDDKVGGLEFERMDWDNGMRCYPSVAEIGGKLFLFYNGNEFGRHGFGAAVLETVD